MAPFRKRSSFAKTVRRVAIAEALWALVRNRGGRAKVLIIGGAATAAGALAFLKRERVAALLPSRRGTPAPSPTPPGPSNYDAPGPVANTATPIPAPEPLVHPAGIDEEAEVAAAAAEAANIGGGRTEYAGPAGETATEAERPLAEAGEGEAEGQEQAEAELVENAILRDAGTTDAEEQLEEAIENQRNPLAGETAEPLVSEEPRPDGEDPGYQTWSGRSVDS